MQRGLGTAAWCCSLLAVACLILGVVATPVGAEEPVPLLVPPPVFVPLICILTACPNNFPPCFTVYAGDLSCVIGQNVYPQCPCFEGAYLPLCFCA